LRNAKNNLINFFYYNIITKEMSNTNGYQTLTKSMNGIIVLSDGSGTTISNGTVSTTKLDVVNLNTQNIVAPNLSTSSEISR